jgi:hypothetical protein
MMKKPGKGNDGEDGGEESMEVFISARWTTTSTSKEG